MENLGEKVKGFGLKTIYFGVSTLLYVNLIVAAETESFLLVDKNVTSEIIEKHFETNPNPFIRYVARPGREATYLIHDLLGDKRK